MQVHVSSRHMSLSAEQSDYTQVEAEKLVHYYERITDTIVTFDHEANTVKAEIVCQIAGGHRLVAIENGATVQDAMHLATENMIRQLNKHKGKLMNRRSPHEPEPKEE